MDTFNPKITHRIAGMYIDEGSKTMTPWQRLADWAQSDKGPAESTNAYITARLKEQWPGNYTVVRYKAYDSRGGWVSGHKIVFDTDAEETWFRLKYPQ